MPSKTFIIKAIGLSILANLSIAFPQAHATVDMKNGNFTDTWIDLLLPSSGFALQVTRTYNSRTDFNGLFGHGWCTDFETALRVLPEGQIHVVECGAGQGTVYRATKPGRAPLKKTVDKMLEEYAKANPDSTKESLRLFQSDLMTSASVRSEWAQTLGLKAVAIVKGTDFFSEDESSLSFDGASYTRRLANGALQKFDRGGKLIALYDRNGNFLKIQYNVRGVLAAVSDNLNRRIVFNLNAAGHVQEIVGPHNTRATYKYSDDDLIEVRNMWQNNYSYQYSETHNLVRIQHPDRTSRDLSYDEKSDRVLSIKSQTPGAPACTESFTYENDSKQMSGHSFVASTRKCGSETPSEAKAEFWHLARPDGSRYLSRVVTKINQQVNDVTYHPEHGQPTQIRRNNDLTTFTYYDNGLLKEKATKFERQSYQYDRSTKKIVRVTRVTLNEKGHAAWKRETIYKYDEKGNMIAALGSDGTRFEVQYDKKGRISSIRAKPEESLLFSYDEKIGKPTLITRPDLGALKVSYNASGDVEKLESKQGGRVKIKIASTLNTFLETISPATKVLSL